MKAKIDKVIWKKEYDSRFGKLQLFQIGYAGKTAYYSSKSKDQTKFVKGQEAEFTEETRKGQSGDYLVIKPMKQNHYSSPTGKAFQREQTKYSGFAVSYVKDLIIAEKVPLEDWKVLAGEMCEFMFELDKRMTKGGNND